MIHRLPFATGLIPAVGTARSYGPHAPERREGDVWLRRAEHDADLLYASVRSFVLAVLWGLYLYSEDGHHHDDVSLAALIAYTALAAFTWCAVWRDWHGRMLAGLTVTADVVLIVAQLAVLSAQAGVPPTQLFALPPATLVFLVVAHAALRFRTNLVLYAGVALAVLLLVAGALPITVDDPALPNPHHYAPLYWQTFPLAVLLLTTVVLWFAARRTRVLLDTAIVETQHAARLARFFSPAVAQHLAEEGIEGPLRGSRQDVAVLFIDIHGFTAMAERMRPEDLGPFLGEFRGLVTRCVFACGDTVDKFIGDGALAVFGAPVPHAGAAASALGCAEAVLAGMTEWSARRSAQGLAPVEVAIGAHHGEVFAGIVGSQGMLEFTVLGDTVNVGERLQRLASETGSYLVVSEAFRRACGGAFPKAAYRHLGRRRLTGRSVEIEAWARQALLTVPSGAAPMPLSGPAIAGTAT